MGSRGSRETWLRSEEIEGPGLGLRVRGRGSEPQDWPLGAEWAIATHCFWLHSQKHSGF